MYLDYRIQKDFIGMDMCRKFLEMGLQNRRYVNQRGNKYDSNGKVKHKKKIGQQVKKQSHEDLKSLELITKMNFIFH